MVVVPPHIALRSSWSEALGFMKRSVSKPKEQERHPTEVLVRRDGRIIARLKVR